MYCQGFCSGKGSGRCTIHIQRDRVMEGGEGAWGGVGWGGESEGCLEVSWGWGGLYKVWQLLTIL